MEILVKYLDLSGQTELDCLIDFVNNYKLPLYEVKTIDDLSLVAEDLMQEVDDFKMMISKLKLMESVLDNLIGDSHIKVDQNFMIQHIKPINSEELKLIRELSKDIKEQEDYKSEDEEKLEQHTKLISGLITRRDNTLIKFSGQTGIKDLDYNELLSPIIIIERGDRVVGVKLGDWNEMYRKLNCSERAVLLKEPKMNDVTIRRLIHPGLNRLSLNIESQKNKENKRLEDLRSTPDYVTLWVRSVVMSMIFIGSSGLSWFLSRRFELPNTAIVGSILVMSFFIIKAIANFGKNALSYSRTTSKLRIIKSRQSLKIVID